MVILYLFLNIFVVAASCTETKNDDSTQNKRILLDDNYNTIISRLDAVEKDNMNMKQNLSAMGQQESALLKIVTDLQQTVSTLQEENASLRNKLLTPQVTFMAYLTSSISGNDHHIFFDDVKLNIGNAYNPHHGMFVAPFNGTYQIQVAACSTRLHFIVLECVVNTDIVGKVLAGDGETANCNLNSFFLQLRQGDDVYVRHVSTGDYLFAYSAYENPSFSGTLLHMN